MANKDLQRAKADKTDTKTNSQPKAKAAKNDENSQGKANTNAQNKTNSQGNAKAQIHGETSIKTQTKAEIHANSQTSPKAENIAQSTAKTTKANKRLLDAKIGKNDEFYTQFGDIQNELQHYQEHFKNKVVYCNCDDPKISNFFLYFANFFWTLNLKKVICSCYKNNDINLFSQNKEDKRGCYFEYNGRDDKGRELRTGGEIAKFIESGLKSKEFQGNGDFRSKESIALLKQADIVVTNPPFSLFREYVAQLMEVKNNKGENLKFIIIGNINAVTYKEVFKYIKANKIWLGASIHSGDREFGVPKHYPLTAAGVRIDANGNKFIRVKGVRWFVNLDYKQRHYNLETIYKYKETPEKYPKYENYDVINVDKTNEIPMDYKGAMGVPITFLDKYNPKQFDILALGIVGSIDFTCNKKMEILDKFGRETGKFTFNAKGTLYRKFNPKTDKAAAFKDCETGELYSSIYARVIIKNKFPKKD